MTTTKKPRAADRLRAVSSAAELHELLSELAAYPRNRWGRTQVLFYLPAAFHGLATEYFRGEHLVIPHRRPADVETVDYASLDSAIAELETFAAAHPGRPSPGSLQVPGLDEVLPPPPGGPKDVLGHVSWALLNEARTVEKRAPKRFKLSAGRCTGTQGESFVYLFSWSSDPEPHMPGRLRAQGVTTPARVGAQGEGRHVFELLCEEYLGPEIEAADFYIDPTFLHRVQLAWLQRFRQSGAGAADRVAALFRGPQSHAPTGSTEAKGLNTRQLSALLTARDAEVSYVWGPPGTGKTTTLGALIRDRAIANERVLVLSSYNVAVDEALEAAQKRGSWSTGQLVRFGRVSERVRDKKLDLDSVLESRAACSGLLGIARKLHAAVVRTLGKEEQPTPAIVRRCIEELGEALVRAGRSARPSDPGLARIMGAIRKLRSVHRAGEPEAVEQAQVVATTIALFSLSALVHGQRFDHVIIDEASVVRTPEALVVALLASSARITFFGDPKQLPSVTRLRSPETDEWLRPNPFSMAGIRGPVDAHGTCVLLDEQHRMATPIRKLVSELFYAGALRDAGEGREGRIVVLDTSKTPARATTRWVRMSRSRENQVHRDVVASLLDALHRDRPGERVLVLAPFRAQTRAYSREPITGRFQRTRFDTVHSSQGSEADTVVLDLVLAPSRGKSRFLDDRQTPELGNLLNVGISRAKRQLIIIAHQDAISAQFPGGLVERLIARATALGERIELPGDMRLRASWKQLFG